MDRTKVAGLGVLVAAVAGLLWAGSGHIGAADTEQSSLPPDLGTRPVGVDWPGMLGPHGDSKSPEQGLITPWPEDGPRVVWQRTLGTGYGAPSIARGRLYLFDRIGNQATLICLNSETGEELWKFGYPTDYEDYFGYNNGPRCCPVVDGDRVYIHGAEGMLHCVNAETGKLIWKVDTFQTFGVVQNFFGVGSAPVVEGDLLIVVEEEEHPTLKRMGNDLYYELYVNFIDAALGASCEVPLVKGKAKIKLEPGTQSGKMVRLRGKGVPSVQGGKTGDMLVNINIWTPQTLTSQEKQALESLRNSENFQPHPTNRDKGFFHKVKEMFG